MLILSFKNLLSVILIHWYFILAGNNSFFGSCWFILQFRRVNLILKIRVKLKFWMRSSIPTPITMMWLHCIWHLYFSHVSLFDYLCSSMPWCFFFRDPEGNQIFTFFLCAITNRESWFRQINKLVPELFYFALQKDGPGAPGGQSWTVQWLKFDNSYFKVLCDDGNMYRSLKKQHDLFVLILLLKLLV